MITICLILIFLRLVNGCVSQPRNFDIIVDAAALSTSPKLKELGTYRNLLYVIPSRCGWNAGSTLYVMRELCLRRYRSIPRTYEVSGNLTDCTFGLKSVNTTDNKAEILLEEFVS